MSNAQSSEDRQKTARENEQDERLAKVTEEVAQDAKNKPAEYLKETVVPAGGE